MASVNRDYYEVLGVPRDADNKTIKNAYHRLAMKYHPDRNSAPDAEDRFKEIAKAYAILSDAKKRKLYDSHGVEGVSHFSDEDVFRNVDLGSIFGDVGFGFGPGGESIFDRFFHHERRPVRGSDISIRLEVPLELINTGGSKTVRFTKPSTCPGCHGFGTHSGMAPKACPACGGTGHKVISRDARQNSSTVRFQQVLTCSDCRGSGRVIEDPCEQCHGTGEVDKIEKLKINIPQGIDDGIALRIPGHGLPGPQGAAAGDLYVNVFHEADARFQRRGADLWRAESIDVDDAVLGCHMVVPTLDGDVDVTVPAGTQPDEVLRLKGKGMTRADGMGAGDLNLRIQLHVPRILSDEEKILYEQLRQLKRK